MIEINERNFNEEVLKNEKPVLLDFWANGCGICRQLAPIFEELSEEMKDTAVFGKINVDENAKFAQMFRIMSIPTVICFKNGIPVKKVVGVVSKEKLKQMISGE